MKHLKMKLPSIFIQVKSLRSVHVNNLKKIYLRQFATLYTSGSRAIIY